MIDVGQARRWTPGQVRPADVRPPRRRTRWLWVLPACAALAAALLIPGIRTTSRPDSFTASLAGGVPRYYVTVFAAGGQLRAEVRSSASGHVTGSVRLPVSLRRGATWQIAGAADDRHFVVAVPVYDSSSLTVFGLSVSASGHPAVRQHRAAHWNGYVFQGLALSPDGNVAALAFTSFIRMAGTVEALNLGTGKIKNWSGAQARGFFPGDLSFVGQTKLAVPWVHYLGPANSVLAGVRTLDVSRPGGSLLSSRLVTFRTPHAVPASAIVTAGGKQIIASFCPAGTGGTVTAKVAVLSGTDGHVIRVLRTENMKVSAPKQASSSGVRVTQALALVTCSVLSVDVTGQHVLAQAFTFGRLDGTKFTRLSRHGGSFYAAW